MACGGCALDLETLLLQMDGLIEARASCREENVTVDYDPKEINEKEILAAIRKAGLRVTIIQKSDVA